MCWPPLLHSYIMQNAPLVMSFFTSFLLAYVGTAVAFQTSSNRHAFVERCEGIRNKSFRETQLPARNDGGMDAFTAQLQAAHAEASTISQSSGSPILADAYANEMMDNSRSAVTAAATATDLSQSLLERTQRTGKHAISSLLMQRAIQTQLYYLADLRDEPTYMWLREFLNHNHLDDKGRFNELDGLRCNGGWQNYLEQLEQAPHFTITVQLAPPKLSAQQQRNPYLAAQAVGRSYEETIMPSKISQTLRAVARSLESEWVPVLMEIAAADRKRVEHFGSPPQIQTAAAAYQAYWQERQIVAGGEGDDQGTPLHTLNSRIVARFCTRVALDQLIKELQEGYDDVAKQGAIEWLRDFSNEWEPRLKRGPDDNVRRSLGVAPPGHWQRLCDGADADDVTEAMWQELPPLFTYESDDAMRLYSPESLSIRLREVRANVCEELIGDLRATVLSMM